MPAVVLFDPGDSAPVELDWSDALDSSDLVSVSHTLPSPLTMLGETFSDTSSFVGISGAIHGGRYLIEAQATLTTTNPDGSPQVLNRQFILQGWNS